MRKNSIPAAAAMLALGLSLQGCVGVAVGGAATVGSAAMQDRGLRGAVTISTNMAGSMSASH